MPRTIRLFLNWKKKAICSDFATIKYLQLPRNSRIPVILLAFPRLNRIADGPLLAALAHVVGGERFHKERSRPNRSATNSTALSCPLRPRELLAHSAATTSPSFASSHVRREIQLSLRFQDPRLMN